MEIAQIVVATCIYSHTISSCTSFVVRRWHVVLTTVTFGFLDLDLVLSSLRLAATLAPMVTTDRSTCKRQQQCSNISQ